MAKPKFLSFDGVRTLVTYMKEKLATKVDKEPGKSLSDNNYSDADVAKLESIESGAQENLIESISINNDVQIVNDKNVNIAIPLVDDTLKNAGQSADAKATGDAIAEVNQSLSQTATAIRQEFDNADNQLAQEMTQALEELSGIIPTKTSELTNDSDYTTKGYVDDEISGVETAIPTKTSELTNDSDYTTKRYVDGELDTLEASIPTKVSQLQNDSSYVTTTQLTNGLATKENTLQYGTATAEDVGKAMMPKTVESGKVTSWKFGEAGKVDDVQINGTSILENKVANVPIASTDKLGVVLANPIYGISVSGFNGDTYINKADLKLIKEGSNIYRPIVPYNQHESAFYGLAKAAGDTTQSSSSNAVGAYTNEAKTAIQSMLGVNEFDFSDRIAKGVDNNGDVVEGAIIEGDINTNKALTIYSHAEGANTTASGALSHAEGASTVANHKSQHVFGEFNIEDPSSELATKKGAYVEIVGNGTSSSTRSNARTLDWSGNEILAGKLTVGANPTNTMDVSTKGYVDTAVSQCMGVADIDATLSTAGKPADAKKVGDEINDLKADLNQIDRIVEQELEPVVSDMTSVKSDVSQIKTTLPKKVNQPLNSSSQPVYGTSGQVLRTKGNGSTEWATVGQPTDEQTAQAVNNWLDDHPEATTTVVDGSITSEKLHDGAVTEEKIDDYLMEKLASGFPDVLPMDVLYNKLWYASDDAYFVLQGACVVGNRLYACFSASGNDTSIKLRVFDISTFNVLNTATLNINHGNSVAHKDEKLYIIGADNKIHVVDLSSLSIETTKSVDYLPVGLCVNASGNLIVVQQGLSIIEYSLPDLEVIKTYDTPYIELKHGVNQYDIEYCDGYYYAVMSGPTSIYVYDDDFELVKCIDIRERYDRITLRETEFVTYMGNGEFMIGWNTILLPSSRITSYPLVEQVTFTKTNFKKGNSNNKEQNIEDSYSPNAIVPIYVNKAYTGNYSDGCWQYPYREVQQAIDNVNIESALYDIRIKPGTYLPIYAVNKQAIFSTWPNQQTAERLQDVTINSIFLINSSFNIGEVKLTEHAATGNYALRVDMNSFCVTSRDASDPEYTVITTLGGIFEARNYFHNVTQNGGMYLFNSNTKRTWDFNKNLANGKIFGRAGMYTGDSRNKTVTVSHGHLDMYVFVIASITIEGHMFKGLIESNVKNDIPFEYYSSGNRIYGVIELTTTRTDIQTTLTCYKGSAAYTPSSFNLLVEGAI